MDAAPPVSSMGDVRTPSVQACIVTTTAASSPHMNSVVEVVPSRHLVGQSSNLITEVLPSGGFTLVNLDLGSLELDQTAYQQLEEYGAKEDELEDGVNLVVKGTWWWCKDCDIKHKFGFGESIEDHLRRKHNVSSNKADVVDEGFTQNSQVDQCRQTPARGGSYSDVISSVYTIPSDSVSVQDQNVETFIVIDGTTTVQVITKPTDNNTVLLSPVSEENKTALAPQNPSKVFCSNGPSDSDVSGNSPHVLKPLSHMKPIPVLPALQLPGTQLPSVLPTSPSPCEGILEKEAESSSTNIAEIRASLHAGILEESKSPSVNIPEVRASCVGKAEKESTSSNLRIPEISSSDATSPQLCSDVGRMDSNVTKSASKCDSCGHTTQNDVKTEAAECDRPVVVKNKPAQSSVQSCGMVTRRKACQMKENNSEGTDVMNCSVELTRVSSEEFKQKNNKPRRSFSKSKSALLPAEAEKQIKDTKKSVLLKSTFSLKESAKKNARKIQSLQHVGKAKRDIFSTTVHSLVSTGKNNTSASMKTRTSSGRKVRKPARYLTGSEKEYEEERPDQQSHYTAPTASSGDENPCPEQGSPQKPIRRPKKRKLSPPADQSSPQNPKRSSKNRRLSPPADQSAPQNPSRCLKNRKLSPPADKSSPQNPSRCPKNRKLSPTADPDDCEMNSDAVLRMGSTKAMDELHSCQDCGREFRYRNKLEKHRRLYAGQPIQRCSVCDKALHSTDLLNVHMYHVHLTKESTSCLTCNGKILGSKRNLLNHLLSHSNTKGQTVANLIRDSCAVHECSVCDEPIVIGEGRVERHYLIHEKPGECVCQKCGQSFRHKKELYGHLKNHGDSDEVVPQCSEQSDMKEGCTVSSQQASQPANPESVMCTEKLEHDLHTDSFNTNEREIAKSMKQIMKFEESTSTPSENRVTVTFLAEDGPTGDQQTSQMLKPLVYCELCKKQFTTKKLLYQHLKVHGSEASDLADDGSLVSGEREPVGEPIDLTAGVPFGIPCSLVKLEFQERDEHFLRKSFTTTPEGLVVPGQIHFTCALCERGFESESKAKRHISRFSSQQIIVQCNLCPCKFHNLDLFNVHYVYIHQPGGPAACMTCKTDFSNKGDFMAHLGNSPLAHPQSHKLGFATLIQDTCGTVTCSVCQKSMWNYPMNIANHTRKHRSLACPICQQDIPYKYALFVHLQVHANSKQLSLSKFSERECQQNEQIEKLHRIMSEVESSAFVESTEKFCCFLCEGEVLCTRKNIHQHLDLHARKLLQSIRLGRYFCPDCGEDIPVFDRNIADHLQSHGQSQAGFVCIFCSQTFGSFDEFKEHESKKHWLNVYFEKNMCEVCGKEFVSRQQFQKHIKLHEEKQGLFSCSDCKQTFRFEENDDEHLTGSSEIGSTQSKLQKHMAKHRKGSYACQFCGKLYMTKLSLDRHEQVVHIGIKDFKHKCKQCEAQFINATHLRDHVTNKHTSGASYRCPQCGIGFQYLSTFARHKRVKHGGDTPYVCQDCGEKFPQKKQLQRHTMVHTGINPFQCPVCPKSFGLERTMNEHFDFCHKGIQRFVCPHCGNKFPRKRSLKRHMETCRMSSTLPLSQLEQGPVYTAPKMTVDIQAAGKRPNAGLVEVQQV